MRLIQFICMVTALGGMLGRTVDGQTRPPEGIPLPSGTEMIAKDAGIQLEIVGGNHPELPDLENGHTNHGGFYVNFKEGGINYARLSPGDLLQQVFVFYRSWSTEEPMDARAVGCPAERYHLTAPVECFRAISRKMEGGHGPVLLQVRFYGMGQMAANIPINTVQIPWTYMRHYATMDLTEKKRDSTR